MAHLYYVLQSSSLKIMEDVCISQDEDIQLNEMASMIDLCKTKCPKTYVSMSYICKFLGGSRERKRLNCLE